MSIKIAVGGAHSTGKSTFLRRIRSELNKLGLQHATVGDLATQCPLPILREHTIESTLWIVASGIAAEISASHQSQIVLVDRPVVDAWAYLKATAKDFDLSTVAGLTLQCSIEHWMPSYDVVYQSQLNETIPIEDDKNRDLDAVYRKRVALEMEGAYKKFASNVRRLSLDNTDSELDVVLKEIERALQRK